MVGKAVAQARMWDYLGELLEASDGEITPELEAEIQKLEGDTEGCLHLLLYLIRRAGNEADNYSAEAKFFQEKAAKRKAQADYFREVAQQLLCASGIKKVQSTHGSASLITPEGTKLILPETDDLPCEYLITETIHKPNKAKIEEALKRGEVIPGVQQVPREPYLQVRLK